MYDRNLWLYRSPIFLGFVRLYDIGKCIFVSKYRCRLIKTLSILWYTRSSLFAVTSLLRIRRPSFFNHLPWSQTFQSDCKLKNKVGYSNSCKSYKADIWMLFHCTFMTRSQACMAIKKEPLYYLKSRIYFRVSIFNVPHITFIHVHVLMTSCHCLHVLLSLL